MVALAGTYLIRNAISPLPPDWIVITFLAPFVWVPIFQIHGLYAPQHLSIVEEARRVMSATSVAIVIVVMASFWSQASFSRLWIGSSWALALCLEAATRMAWRRHRERLRADGKLSLRTVIVGTNDEAERLARTLQSRTSGFEPIGSLAVGDLYIERDNNLKILGRTRDLLKIVREQGVECIFVASTDITPEGMVDVIKTARREKVDVKLSASLPKIISSRVTMQSLGGAMTLSLRPVQLNGLQKVLKRAFDLFIAIILTVLALPVAAVVALALLLEGKGPVLFKQERVTQGGRVFEMYKFRTMVAGDPSAHNIDTSRPFFKMDEDPRVTPIGRFMRRTSLDELPQLINVIRGDMSLVGPRPLPADQVAANLELLDARHEVPAGVTGWWQINGRSRVSPEDAVRFDLFYIENWSLSLDVYVLLKTLVVLATRKGAV